MAGIPPLVVRLPLAAVLLVFAARTDRRWLVPVCMVLASPVIGWGTFALLAAIPRLRGRGPASEAARRRHIRRVRTGDPYAGPVITAIVFVKADVARIPEVAEAIAALEGISEVYSVTGQIDLIALVRVRAHEDVADVVADRLNKVEGVTSTETHIAFRAYSRHDLESAFSLGLD